MNSDIEILIVDDDEIISMALKETLLQERYKVTTLVSAFEALELVKHKDFTLIISDQRMAELSGLQFLCEIKKIKSYIGRILITGVVHTNVIMEAVNKAEVYGFIPKPWIREDMLSVVRNALARSRYLASNTQLNEDILLLNEKLIEENTRLKQELSLCSKNN